MSNGTGGGQAPNWTASHTAGCCAAAAGIAVVALSGAPTLVSWLLFMLLMVAFTAIAADGITDSAHGIIIDDRNKMSLAQLQMALWTWIVLSGFLAATIGNVRAHVADPLDITIPQAVWLLMGISTTSMVGAPLILSTKRSTAPTGVAPATGPAIATPAAGTGATSPLLQNTPVTSRRPLPAAVASVLIAQGENPNRMSVEGSVVVKHSAKDASWADLFKGDGVGDVATLDLAQIQMFFFTIVLVLSYAIALGTTFVTVDAARAQVGPAPGASPPAAALVGSAPAAAGKPAPPDPKRVDGFPPFDSGLVTLLGISNAGFLANKVIPRTQPA